MKPLKCFFAALFCFAAISMFAQPPLPSPTNGGGGGGGGGGNAASAVTTTCSGASATFTATSNTINRFDCTLVATNVTSSTLASLTSGGLYTIVITQPGGGGITFAAPTGLTGFLAITTGNGDAAGEVCTVEFVATSTTTGRVNSQNCSGGTPGVTFSNLSSGTTSYRGPSTGTNVATAPGGTQTLLGHNATNTFGTSGTLDMSAVTNDEAFRLPNVAGAANTTEGACSYDTTNDNVHCGENGVDTILPSVLVSAPLVNGNCVQASVTSSRVRLSDAGSACGGGSTPGTGGNYFIFGDPQYTAGGAAAVNVTLSGVANGGSSISFIAKTPTITKFIYRVVAAGSSGQGFLMAITNAAQTSTICSAVATGTDVTATGTKIISASCSGLVIGQPYKWIMSSDATAMTIAAYSDDANFSIQNEDASAGVCGTSAACNFGYNNSGVTTGTGGSLALTTLSSVSWSKIPNGNGPSRPIIGFGN